MDGRSTAALARQDATSGRIASASPSSTGGSCRTRCTIAGIVAASNGLRPVAAKASTQPSANTSAGGPDGSPRTCSGAM
nr:hypothetical protein [Actinomadura geliboluensis]